MPALNRLLPKPELSLEELADSSVLSAGAEGPTLVAVPISAVMTLSGRLLGAQLDGNCSVAAFITRFGFTICTPDLLPGHVPESALLRGR